MKLIAAIYGRCTKTNPMVTQDVIIVLSFFAIDSEPGVLPNDEVVLPRCECLPRIQTTHRTLNPGVPHLRLIGSTFGNNI